LYWMRSEAVRLSEAWGWGMGFTPISRLSPAYLEKMWVVKNGGCGNARKRVSDLLQIIKRLTN